MLKWATRLLLLTAVLMGFSTVVSHYSDQIVTTTDSLGVAEVGLAVTAIASHGWELPDGAGEGPLAFVDMTAAFAAWHNANSIEDEFALQRDAYESRGRGPAFGSIGG